MRMKCDFLFHLTLGMYVLDGKIGNQGRQLLVYLSWLLHSGLSATSGARRRLFLSVEQLILPTKEDFEL